MRDKKGFVSAYFGAEELKPEGLDDLKKTRRYIIGRLKHFETELSIIEKRIKQDERWNANALKNTND